MKRTAEQVATTYEAQAALVGVAGNGRRLSSCRACGTHGFTLCMCTGLPRVDRSKPRRFRPAQPKPPGGSRLRPFVSQVRRALESGEAVMSIARRYGSSPQAVYRLRNGTTYRDEDG